MASTFDFMRARSRFVDRGARDHTDLERGVEKRVAIFLGPAQDRHPVAKQAAVVGDGVQQTTRPRRPVPLLLLKP
eukprot:13189495-Alexandrium_andersonii.AAC.1